MKEKLNIRQKKFAEYYAQSGNTVQSAIKAGYSEKYANALAYKLLENIGVSEYIKELNEKQQQDRIITATERQAILSDIAKNEEETTSDRIKAIETLNKMTGEYLNKVEVSGTVNNPFATLTTEQLIKLAGNDKK